ncbi:acyl-CoA thioesterase [Virgibacillus alimentarius]|uniref:Acyl-CoA thioester hydrolase n=1 Tax=Virgibacillus alimentarius TaxID=698769 RepID=A0ABS4SAZ0_9BACI|nr:thioesterase family protein [Virgibacillus alimentarius]MBP2258670.1 acyl-CoA thioester hydrolase [Virgibacillus alimentarius]
MEVDVRVSETDLLGHVNHANYFTYMEEGRLSFLKELGLQVEDEGFSIMLASAKCDFIRQGYFNQTLIVNTKVTRVGNSSFNLGSDIIEKESGELIAKGEVTIVYFDVAKQKSTPLKESFREKLNQHLEA